MAEMKQIECAGAGGVEVMQLTSARVPEPGAGQIRIKIAYAGVNRPDLMQRAGLYPPPADASPILGLECAGTVDAVGAGANWQIGDRVCALLAGGGYAEYAIVDARHALPVPENMTLKAAAALPETFFTVWTNVFQRARLAAGERFLVHGGTSGIGVAAISLARAFGADVYATAGSDEKCAFIEEMGARAINYRTQDFEEVLRQEKVQLDVILDMVGGDYIQKNINALATEGRLVNIAYQKGFKAEINFLRVMLKRLSIMGSTLRTRSDEDKAQIADELGAQVWPKLAAGAVGQHIYAIYPLAEAAKAHEALDAGTHIGKILLEV